MNRRSYLKPMLTVFFINALIIALVVVIHYELLYRCTVLLPRLSVRARFRTLIGVFVALFAHVIEVCIFAVAYYYMDAMPGWGMLRGDYDGTLYSSVYFSFATYTTLGMGDIVPHGDIRFLVALESLAGFVLITWTASFLYLEMTRNWPSTQPSTQPFGQASGQSHEQLHKESDKQTRTNPEDKQA